MRKQTLMDFSHDSTLAYAIGTAFQEAAPAHGVRLVGLEDDANEHSMFWLEVARALIRANFHGSPNAAD